MNPRTKRNLILIAVLVILMVAVILWAKTPRTFEQAMGNDFDRTRVDHVQAFVPTVRDGDDTHKVTLSPEDPAYEALWALLDAQEYYPVMEKVHGYQMQLDHYAFLAFLIREEDGLYSSYEVDIPGSRYIQFLSWEKNRHFSPSGGLEFQQDVIDLLLAQPSTAS